MKLNKDNMPIKDKVSLIEKLRGSFKAPDNLDYKQELTKILLEKYGELSENDNTLKIS
jgi:hypothetical protein